MLPSKLILTFFVGDAATPNIRALINVIKIHNCKSVKVTDLEIIGELKIYRKKSDAYYCYYI